MSTSVPQRREVELVRIVSLSPTVRALVLQTLDREPIQWRAGQYVELLLPNVEPKRQRPFSIASAPDPEHPGRLELAVVRDETSVTATAVLSLSEGQRLELVGPKGELTRQPLGNRPTLMVATGTGVAPLRAMIQAELGARPTGPPLVLLFGARTEQELLWAREFRRVATHYPRFHFEPTLSRPGEQWTGRVGYVQQHIEELLRPLGQVPVLLCGQPEMIGQARAVLDAMHHPGDLVFTEQQG